MTFIIDLFPALTLIYLLLWVFFTLLTLSDDREANNVGWLGVLVLVAVFVGFWVGQAVTS